MAYRYEENDYEAYWGDDYLDPYYDEELEYELQFADPGGRSALRAGERTEPCPNCARENVLTKKDVELGYQCDACADALEGNPHRMEDY